MRMCSLLTDSLPVEFLQYRVKTSYKQVLKLFKAMQDPQLTESEQNALTIMLFFDEPKAQDLPQLIKFVSWYLSRGKESPEQASALCGKKKQKPRTFDLLIDENLIYCAFLQVYGIDLLEQDLHWWVFMELVDGLPDGTRLSEIMKLRGMEPPKLTKDNAEQVAEFKEMQKRVALEPLKSYSEKLDDLFHMI